jgi:hypothetical protein
MRSQGALDFSSPQLVTPDKAIAFTLARCRHSLSHGARREETIVGLNAGVCWNDRSVHDPEVDLPRPMSDCSALLTSPR